MNTAFPALPDYTGPDSGLAGWVHHDKPFAYCRSFKERIAYIRATKPANEIPTRLRCLVYLDPTGQPWAEALTDLNRTQAALNRALAALDRAQAETLAALDRTLADLNRAQAVRNRALAALNRARAELDRAQAEWDQYAPQIEAQIRALIPDLPWNGISLVFEEVR